MISEGWSLKAEALKALPALRECAFRRAGPEGVRRVIGQRFATYPQPERSDGEWSAWWADYEDALEELPESAIEAGMKAHVRSVDGEFLPKPGRLLMLAETTENPAAKAYARAKRAVEYVKPPPFLEQHGPKLEPEPPTTKVDREEAKAWAEQFLLASRLRNLDRRPAIKPNHGKTDETGITPELRGLLARQRPA